MIVILICIRIYFTYIQILGGRLAETYGPTRVIGGTIVSGGFLALISPVVARASLAGFIALRVIHGMCQVHICIFD